MATDWHRLTDVIGNRDFRVTGIRMIEDDISLTGEFDLPPLARLPYEDQVFIGEFVRSHGSIKHMEKAFGVSYPTIKSRLNRISKRLNLVEVTIPEDRADVLAELEKGEITAGEALERLKK
jgi:hypothetical protein